MKKNRNVTSFLLVLLSVILLEGCTTSDNDVAPKKSDPVAQLTNEQRASIHAQADKIAREELSRLESGANLRNPDQYDLIGLNVTSVTGTGPTSATYGFNSGVRNPALLSPGQQTAYNYLFCAAPSHFRYAVVYFYNGYTHTASSINAIYGPTNGCLLSTTNFSVSIGGPNSSQTFVIIFDVLNGPGGGATQVAGPIWSNSRDLSYPNYHILNPGNYWF
jgi:hypothetical protein